MKALLAVDGSAHALRAAHTLVDLSKHCARTEVHVLNVQPRIAYVDLIGADRQASIDRWVQARGRGLAQDACGVLTAGGLPFEIEVVAADAALAIARIAVERRCDFILMGTRGMGSVAGLALGSVATKVVHLADLPVTLVK